MATNFDGQEDGEKNDVLETPSIEAVLLAAKKLVSFSNEGEAPEQGARGKSNQGNLAEGMLSVHPPGMCVYCF